MTLSKFQIIFFLILVVCYQTVRSESKEEYDTYSSDNRVRSGIAMGGLGTGSIELRKDGNFYNWSIFNNFPLGSGPYFKLPVMPEKRTEDSYLFFLVRYQVEGEKPKLKLLQLNNALQEGALEGIIYYYPWMSAINQIKYQARFPFTNLVFSDAEMPFTISLEAFSPFIPHDVKNSSLPGAFFRFKIESESTKKIQVMLVGTLRNLVSYDQIEKSFESDLVNTKQYKFFVHGVSGVDKSSPSFGQLGLGALGGNEVSYYLGWEHKHPYYEKLLISNQLSNIDDTQNRNTQLADGKKIGRLNGSDNDQRCFSSIAVSGETGSGKSIDATFLMGWYFPNSYGAVNDGKEKSMSQRNQEAYSVNLKRTKRIGHFYENHFEDVKSVAQYMFHFSENLLIRSHQFVDNMYSSNLEPCVLNQVNSQLNTFITSSVFTKNGGFAIREGITPSQSWGPNGTMDVSLYGSPMIISMFPELQKSMMRAHKRLQTADGEVNHGLGYDLDFNQNGTWGVYERIDLVPDYIQMVLRDYFWTNDKEYLNEMWPSVKKGIEYILKKRDLNGDKMPDMNGIMCSYDNFPMYGLASYVQSQWIVALKMASLVATEMGEKGISKEYNDIANKGRELMEEKLWNGSYYNLSNDYTGNKGIDNGCLTDQLIGQWVADGSGLGHLFDSQRIKKSLRSILDKSFIDSSFVRNCTWPQYPDLFPIHNSDLWVDQANTPWTGVELAFASLLIYEGMPNEGLKVVRGVDNRYRKAGLYFDHQEFGGHYYRPMSAWSIMNAYLGFSINRGTMSFKPALSKTSYKVFFMTPTGTAFYEKRDKQIKIELLSGTIDISKIQIEDSTFESKAPCLRIKEKNTIIKGKKTDQIFTFTSAKNLRLETGDVIEIH